MIPKTIQVGYQGEKDARYIDIDISDMITMWSDAVPSILHKRHGDDEAYPVRTEQIGNTLRWHFSAVDAAVRGFGEAQVVMATEDGEIIGKSRVIETVVGRSLEAGEDTPEQFEPWINQAVVIKAEMETAAADARESADRAEQALEDLRVGIQSGDFKGEKGDPGQKGDHGVKGEDGVSPTASVRQTSDGAVVTVTDASGTTSATIRNGTQGVAGRDGKDGKTPVKGVDYFDGRDGHTPVKGEDYFDGDTPVRGVDYWTDSDKAGIIDDVKNGLDLSEYAKETDLGNLKNSINQFKTDTESEFDEIKNTIANQKGVFVATYNVTTSKEIRDAIADGKVIFVHDGNSYAPLTEINSSSITFTIAGTNSTSTYRFLESTSVWTKSYSFNVDANNPYAAVKKGLTDASAPAWTAEEQLAAQQRIGIGGDFELIIDDTLTQRIGNLSYKATMDGEPLTKFSAFLILINAMQDTNAGSYDTYLVDDNGSIFCSAAQQSLISTSNDSVARVGFTMFHNIWINFENKCSTSTTWYGNTYAQHTRRDVESFGVGSRCSSILFANRNAGSFAVGSTIKIYGVRT